MPTVRLHDADKAAKFAELLRKHGIEPSVTSTSVKWEGTVRLHRSELFDVAPLLNVVASLGSWIFDEVLGRVKVSEDGSTLIISDVSIAASEQGGWHILIDADLHARWHEARHRLGLTIKDFTTLCIEYFIDTVLERDLERARLLADQYVVGD